MFECQVLFPVAWKPLNPFQPKFFLIKFKEKKTRYLLNSYSNAHEIFNAHGEHLRDQYKLLIIPLEDVPLLLVNGSHGNYTQFYVLCIFKTHEIKLI